MSTQLYPRPKKDKTKRRWRLDYDHGVQQNHGAHWCSYHHHKELALIAAWWHVYILEWDGRVTLVDQRWRPTH